VRDDWRAQPVLPNIPSNGCLDDAEARRDWRQTVGEAVSLPREANGFPYSIAARHGRATYSTAT